MYQIEISKGLDFYNSYLVVPVIVSDSNQIAFEEVLELETTISIGKIYVDHFLMYFLNKYFDPTLEENIKRVTCWRNDSYQCELDELGGYNFYNYNSLNVMIEDLLNVAELLENDYDNPYLRTIIETFDVHFMHDSDSDVWSTEEFGTIKDHISVVSDFYRRFADHLNALMFENPNAHLVSIEYGY